MVLLRLDRSNRLLLDDISAITGVEETEISVADCILVFDCFTSSAYSFDVLLPELN